MTDDALLQNEGLPLLGVYTPKEVSRMRWFDSHYQRGREMKCRRFLRRYAKHPSSGVNHAFQQRWELSKSQVADFIRFLKQEVKP